MSTIKSDSLQPTLGTNNLILRTGSADTERIRITPQGTILIGTQSNPENDDATTLFVASKTANNAILARLYNTSSENGAYIGLQLNNNANNGYVINYGSGHPNAKIVSLENDTAGNGLLLYSGSASGPIRFSTVGVERMRINSSGNMGIGTVSPVAKLDVRGTVSISDNGVFPTSSSSLVYNRVLIGGTGPAFFMWDNGSSVAAGRYARIGLGSRNAADSLLLAGGYIDGGNEGTADHKGYLAFYTTPTDGSANLERMRINSSGNVGIGTNSPAVTLDVNGEARCSNSTTSASNAKTLTTKDYVDSLGIGIGQTWTNLTGSRSSGVQYTNSTGKPIMVCVGHSDTGTTASVTVVVNSVTIISQTYDFGSSYGSETISFIVPNSHTYTVTAVPATTISHWAELRG